MSGRFIDHFLLTFNDSLVSTCPQLFRSHFPRQVVQTLLTRLVHYLRTLLCVPRNETSIDVLPPVVRSRTCFSGRTLFYHQRLNPLLRSTRTAFSRAMRKSGWLASHLRQLPRGQSLHDHKIPVATDWIPSPRHPQIALGMSEEVSERETGRWMCTSC